MGIAGPVASQGNHIAEVPSQEQALHHYAFAFTHQFLSQNSCISHPSSHSHNMASQESQCESTAPIGLSFIDQHPFVRQAVVDRVYGCIIGSALGDAIGLYTEFLPKTACERLYPDRKFSLVEPTTEFYIDTHRGESGPLPLEA